MANSVGQNVRKYRELLGMSQEELAVKVGYSGRSSINKIELGSRDITQSKIKKIADVLGITPGMLMGWEVPDVDCFSDDVQIELFNKMKQLELSDQQVENLYNYAVFLSSQRKE